MERKGVTLETAEPDTTGYAVTGGPLPRLREIGLGRRRGEVVVCRKNTQRFSSPRSVTTMYRVGKVK